ncbi:unnamed protein product [Rhizophagus irregularis]|uniref:Uncharacterized protein n=1 Tax=Rhizophagus irregularis TaxID=588596 RepID=A0A2I1EKJ9_9GLOM|nr:hypothetical protein RhiirB3_436652 [Rhizophagus irregularis]CAB5374740.1 unnamed protein product [Rhizophagus irregularis]
MIVQIIRATLEELENTFFIENSSSEVKRIYRIIMEIASINRNFENLQLSNFKFANNSNNCVEDNIYDDLKLKVKEIFEKENVYIILIVLKKLGMNGLFDIRQNLDVFSFFEEILHSKKVKAEYHFNDNLQFVILHTWLLLELVINIWIRLKNIYKNMALTLEEYIHANTYRTPKK